MVVDREGAGLRSWWQRQARWKRLVVLMVAAYAVAVPLNLLIRWALKGWEWHPDLLISALITGASWPIGLPIMLAIHRRAAEREAGSGDRREPGATDRGDARR